MRILYVTHTEGWSGAEAQTARLIAGLADTHEVAIACPSHGRFAAEADRLGVRWFPIAPVQASFRLHLVQTSQGLGSLGAAAAALRRACRRFRPDVIHASTVRAGLITALARVDPAVVHVHDNLPGGPMGRGVRAAITRTATDVVAVSQFTADRFNGGLSEPVAHCVYNGLDHTRLDPVTVAPAPLRHELGLDEGATLLGVVGQITPWKGQDTAILALSELRRGGFDAHLAIVGEIAFSGAHVRHDNHAFLQRLHALTAHLGLGDAVHFLGQRADVPELLAGLDLLLTPSWDEPFGLVVIEAAAMGTPAVIGSVGGLAEILEDGVSGVFVQPRRPELWVDAIADLVKRRHFRARMGQRAQQVAARFSDERHREEMLAVYERAAGSVRTTAGAVANVAAR